MERWLVGVAGALGLVVAGVGAFYLFSYLILTLAGRLLPLAGSRRRRD